MGGKWDVKLDTKLNIIYTRIFLKIEISERGSHCTVQIMFTSSEFCFDFSMVKRKYSEVKTLQHFLTEAHIKTKYF